MNIILVSIFLLGGIGLLAAAILFFVAKKFNVEEDPRVEQVEAVLPGANCGGCGFSGCHDFAVNCVKAPSLEGFNCPGGGEKAMKRIAEILGLTAVAAKPMVAALHCHGTRDNRPTRASYDGVDSCAILAMVAAGGADCSYGCLGQGDCAKACKWNALSMDPTTGLPVVDTDACTGCGACVAACPRRLFELRARGPRGMRVWVACSNCEKGPLAFKECRVSCIGCGKCQRACPHDAITVKNNLAYIDHNKCRLCRKCVDQCPTHAIHAVNFPAPRPTAAKTQE
jgi:RnfABCDGE-type electron transport complex B subunit